MAIKDIKRETINPAVDPYTSEPITSADLWLFNFIFNTFYLGLLWKVLSQLL